MDKLNALVVYNGIEGLDKMYQSNDDIDYTTVEVTKNFNPDLSGYDVLLAPNGTDHIAMFKIKDQVAEFLNRGGILFCFDGWFTDWIPGNRWLMDNSKKTINTRYKIKDDPYGMGANFSAEDLTFSHGISGWWSCGFIEPAPDATVFLEDTWGRALVVIDEKSTNGTIVLTASGPVADFSYATTDDSKAYMAMVDLYREFIKLAKNRKAIAI